MNGSLEPRERLRIANPVPAEEAPSPDSLKGIELFRRITATDPEAPRARRVWRRRSPWVLVPAALLVAATGYGILRNITNPLTVACYPQSALSSGAAVVSGNADDPVAACADLWRTGGAFNPQGDRQPTLVACVLTTGVPAVFPAAQGADTCATLGLASARDSTKSKRDDEAVLEVQNALSDAFLSRCVGHDEAVSIAQQELATHALQGWTVTAEMPFTVEEPCASLAMDVATRTISIVPVRDQS